MSTWGKRAILLAAVVMVAFQAYASYQAGPVVAGMFVEYNKTHPVNWFDIGLGAFAGAFTVAMIFVTLTLFEAKRFEGEVGGGPKGPQGSGGGSRKIRLPMSPKVIDIRTWNPPPGQMHMGASAI